MTRCVSNQRAQEDERGHELTKRIHAETPPMVTMIFKTKSFIIMMITRVRGPQLIQDPVHLDAKRQLTEKEQSHG